MKATVLLVPSNLLLPERLDVPNALQLFVTGIAFALLDLKEKDCASLVERFLQGQV